MGIDAKSEQRKFWKTFDEKLIENGEPLRWVEGTRNKNTRRIAYEIPVNTGYYSNYDETIDKVLPIVDKMKKVCEK